MKFFLLLLLAGGIAPVADAQNIAAADSGVFLLHKFEQHIGKETYRIYNHKDAKQYSVDFKFVDRGTPVPLKADMKINPAGDPLSDVSSLRQLETVIKGGKVYDPVMLHQMVGFSK